MTETVLTHALLVLPERTLEGTLVVRDGRIAEIGEGRSTLPGALDLEGDALIPGLVELHTDNLERHFMPRPKTTWPLEAAVVAHDAELAISGITTVCDGLRIGEIEDENVIDQKTREIAGVLGHLQRGGHLRTEHFIHLRCEVAAPETACRFEEVADDPLLRLVSVMDHTPGQRQFVDLDKFRNYYGRRYGLAPDDIESWIVSLQAMAGKHARANRKAILTLCRERGIAAASHDDATEEHVAEAVEDGITIAEFPTTLAAAEASRMAGLAVCMGAPNVVRGGSHSGNVSALAAARAGLLDVLSSDYVPGSLIQGAFQIAEAVEGLDLASAIASVTDRPARAIGLEDRGALREGLRADLVRVGRIGSLPVPRHVWLAGRRIA